MDITELFAATSCIAALLSALYASQSRRIAQKALEVTRIERKVKEGNGYLYLSDIFATDSEAGERSIVANILCVNQSEVSDSIVRVELVVRYLVDDMQTNAVIQINKELPLLRATEGMILSSPPIKLEPRGSESICACFKLPAKVNESVRIDSYEIEVSLSSGVTLSVESAIAGVIADE